MRDSVLVGIRMESAMKPIFFTSGMTSARASAAPVEVRMILFRMLRFFLRSFSPAFGMESRTDWVLVTACTVDMEAVRILLVASFSSSGLTMWAKPVVVQEAADNTWWAFLSKAV